MASLSRVRGRSSHCGARLTARLFLLHDERVYRSGFLEVDPARRGALFGVLTLATVAMRALELGAEKVLSESLPETADWHQGNGAVPAEGWKAGQDLVALQYGRDVLEQIVERANAYQEDA